MHGGTIVVEADPADFGRVLPLRPVGFFVAHAWTALAVRADGSIVALRQADAPGPPAVVDVVDPATGEIVDTVALRADAGTTQLTEWIDFDAAGRYLLYTDGEGRLRWTDFDQAGILGEDGGCGDAGW